MEKWVVKNKKADFQAIMNKFGVSEVLARLMVNRGYETEDKIDEYLNLDLNRLHSPHTMKDMKKAVDIMESKIQQGENIRIVGDYDVDGVISTYILYTALKRCGAKVDYEIPDRIKDGYGINISIVEAAKEDGIDTIITCDNGIAAMDQIERANELGMTVIVTDHHDISFTKEERTLDDGSVEKIITYHVPNGAAVINPKQEECNYPFEGICGATVAYKFIESLYERLQIPKEEAFLLLEYVAIATVCDVMDLVDENRIIVKTGLQMIQQTKNYGLKALMDVNGIHVSSLSAYHLGFIIGPCLNASGRLESAKLGLKLLQSTNPTEALSKAIELKQLNDTRKEMTLEGTQRAIEMVETSPLKEDLVLVVYLPECHESLAGIIAGRLKEKYNKPAIVLTKAEHGVKGSARSIPEYNIYEELTRCKEYLLKYGGHPMAAGLSLEEKNINHLRIALNQYTTLTKEDIIPKVSIDIVMPLGYVTEEVINELELLEPFGKGNSKPIFAERNLRIRKAAIIGKNSNVIKMLVENQYGKVMDALFFGDIHDFQAYIGTKYGYTELENMFSGKKHNITLSVTYYPSVNEYGGNKTLQIIIQNYQ